LNTARNAAPPALGKEAVSRIATLLQPPQAQAAAELAGVLKRNPPRPSSRRGSAMQIYMMDLVAGGTNLIVDEAVPGKNWSASGTWSHDGKRIAFDTSRGENWSHSYLMMLEARDGRPTFTELGPGNYPTFSRDDKRIASCQQPDLTKPTMTTVIQLEAVKAGVVEVPGYHIFSWPRWAGPGRIVATLGTGVEGEMIAILDVTDPARAKIVKTLWKRGPELDVYPRWTILQPGTDRCFFVGVAPGNRRTLCATRPGEPGRAEPLEPGNLPDMLGGLSFSPDGRYLLFNANRPERR
jgi:Tol biopolymer transport system component